MALFGNKNKEEKPSPCCCGNSEETACCGSQNATEVSCGEINSIKVLGAGCKSCHEQYENVKKAVAELGIDVEVEYITDMEKVMTYGVMSMPAIVVNDKIASAGRVMKTSDVIKLLR